MKNTHRTQDGETFFISQMTNEHLENTIKMHLKRIKESSDIVNNVKFVSNVDFLLAWIDNESVKEKAKNILKSSYGELWKYLIEAYIRGLDLKNDFQEAFWRKEKAWDYWIITNQKNWSFLFWFNWDF